MLSLHILLSIIVGAAWRRWFGSARPSWAFPGYRASQIASGFIVLALIQVVAGDYFWRCALDSALAIGFMTLPIQYSRRPFEIAAEWLVRHGLWTTAALPHPYKPWLQGAAPWAEVIQGACLFALAVLI